MRWLEVKLGQVLSIEHGAALPQHERHRSGSIPVVGSKGIVGTHNDFLVRAPGIVVGRKGSAGKVSWLDKDFWLIDTSFYVTPLVPAEMRWLFYLLKFLKLERLAGGVIPGLNRNDVYQLKIPLVPLSEQRKIVGILDHADALRKKRAEADAKGARILPALFIKTFGDPALNPMGWPDKRLNDVMLQIKPGTATRTTSNGETSAPVPLLRMNNIDSRGRLDLSDVKYIKLSAQELSHYELKSGDLLFNRTKSRQQIGTTALWQGQLKAVASSAFISMRADQTQLLPEYVWAYMNTPFIKQILSDKGRRAIGMRNINAKELRSLPILIPDLESQQAFKETIARLDLLTVKRAGNANAKLENLFELLLHRAFSGQLTAKWRQEHQEQLQNEMEEQSKLLAQAKKSSKKPHRRKR